MADALKKSGASSSVVSHVDRTLAIPSDPDPLARERAVSEARAVVAKIDASNPDQLLQVAKLQFQGGRPVVGYEYLNAYVSADNASAGKALQIAFVEPVTLFHHKNTGSIESPPAASAAASNDQALAAAAAAATAAAKDAAN